MCRIYGHIAPDAVSGLDLLADSSKSLFAQSNVKEREQKDGWGLGYYKASGQAAVLKSPGTLYKEEKQFRAAAAKAVSKIVIGHIRAASNPRGLKKSGLIGLENTQPFTYKNFVFAHNGTVNIPDAVIKGLGPWSRRVRGVNDSEAYFWQFIKYVEAGRSVPDAFRACVQELRELWNRGARIAGKEGPFNGLNTVVSDGTCLYVLCLYPGPTQALLSPRPWGDMVFAHRGHRTVVASEPLDDGRWNDLKTGDIMTLQATGLVRREGL